MDQRLVLSTKEFETAKQYWLTKLSSDLSTLHLDYDHPVTNPRARGVYHSTFDQDLTNGLERMSKGNHLSLYVILLTALKILIYKYTGLQDLIISSPVFSKKNLTYNRWMGLRDELNSEWSFREAVMKVKETVSGGYKNQHYPIRKLLELLQLDGGLLTKVILVLENIQLTDILNEIISDFGNDLTITINKGTDNMSVQIEYAGEHFREESIKQFFELYSSLVKQVVHNPELIIRDIELISPAEKKRIIQMFDDSQHIINEVSLQKLFAEQVAKSPDNIAVISKESELTYEELNQSANKLQRYLRTLGVLPEMRIGIMVQDPLNLAVGIFGILNVGACYVPIDPAYPKERICFMIEDSGISHLLVDYAIQDSFGEITMIDVTTKFTQCDAEFCPIESKATDACYIIYTSGTTGQPKGVVVEQRNVVNTLLFRRAEYKMDESYTCLQLFTYAFDGFVTSFFTPLISGAKIVLLDSLALKDISKVEKAIVRYQVNHFIAVPPLYKVILNYLSAEKLANLKLVTLAGDRITEDILQESREKNPDLEIVNEYGVTEVAVMSTIFRNQESSAQIRIGKPIWNTEILILDPDGNLAPSGVGGELCIAGQGVSRGYVKRAELTAEKFTQGIRSRMYRTGDRARWDSDGNIEYLRRIDQQIKVRGFRIEPQEIEKQLLSLPQVKEAVVYAEADSIGGSKLLAYLISDRQVAEITTALATKVPEYMIPAQFVLLERMPLTPAGKIDRVKLLALAKANLSTEEYQPPTTETEEILCAIFAEVLDLEERIGVNDNFFKLGGHSLKATKLIQAVQRELALELPLLEIFSNPTVKGLAEYISTSEQSIYESIQPVEIRPSYPLSSAQKRLYVLEHFAEKNTGYNLPTALSIIGQLDVERVEDIFIKLIQRHPSLRTGFVQTEVEVGQKISAEVAFQIDYFDIELEKADVNSLIEEYIRPFDLATPPLLRVMLIKKATDQHILVLDMHHIIADGLSLKILVKEFINLYNNQPLKDLHIQYTDYACWQITLGESEVFKDQESYWLKQFSGELPVLKLPLDYPRSRLSTNQGKSVKFMVDEELTIRLKELAIEHKATLYMVLLAAYYILLYRYTQQEDIVVGSPIAGRNHPELYNVIGMFVNTLALRNRPEGSKSFNAFLAEVRKTTLRGFKNQDYQFEDLVDKLNPVRDVKRNPLFDTMFAMQNLDVELSSIQGLEIKQYGLQIKQAKFDISYSAVQSDQELVFEVEYKTELFKESTIKRMIKHYEKILAGIVANPRVLLADIDILSADERKQLLVEFIGEKRNLKHESTICQLFAKQVRRRGEGVALVAEDCVISYAELDRKSTHLALKLRDLGVRQDQIVGICVEPSVEMIVGILGILKAGGAYLPLEPDHPVKRLAYMCEDSAVSVVVTMQAFIGRLAGISEVVLVDDLEASLEEVQFEDSLNQLAYIIYTSGTTGEPKGVMVERQGVVNLVSGLEDRIYKYYGPNLKVALLASYVFDASIQQIFASLLLGHRLYIVDKDKKRDGYKLLEFYQRHSIDISDGTPSHLKLLVQAVVEPTVIPLKHFIIGGEVLLVETVRKFCEMYGESTAITNIYGPAECCVDSTAYTIEYAKLTEQSSIPIGSALVNKSIYILDDTLNPVPLGVEGEIYISGEGLARGYIRKAELTAERFIRNPFDPGMMMYKTGDLGRWLENGCIEFSGRVDHQVKIRGYRIEPGEIENQLLKIEGIKEAVVVAKEEGGGGTLIGYLTSESTLKVQEIRNELKRLLPEYMIPAQLILIEKMPLNASGKVNLHALEGYYSNIVLDQEYHPPEDRIQAWLVSEFADLLRVSGQISIDDSFFDLGGNSLIAMTLANRIYREFDLKITVGQVFQAQTIRMIADYVHSTVQERYLPIQQLTTKPYYPLSKSQSRIYFLHHMQGSGILYNIPTAVQIRGELDCTRVQEVFATLLERHEILRAYFPMIDGEPVQRIGKNLDLQVEDYPVAEMDRFVREFDLARPPLIRVGVVKLAADQHILLMDIHHIIADGVSIKILLSEFLKLYTAQDLPPVTVKYSDYVIWEREMLDSEFIKEQEEYWLEQFSGENPVLELPYDHQPQRANSWTGKHKQYQLDLRLCDRLDEFVLVHGVTKFTLFLTAYYLLLFRYTQEQEIVVATPTSGRSHPDLENVIGLFINTLAFKQHLQSDENFLDLLHSVQENLLQGLKNQDYQFAELVQKLNLERDLEHNPLFDTVLTYEDSRQVFEQIDDLEISPYPLETDTAKFALTLSIMEGHTNLTLAIEYRTDLFLEEKINRLAEHFLTILKDVIDNPDKALKDVHLLSATERELILEQFNDTREVYAQKSLVQYLEERVSITPEDLAVITDEEVITCREFNQRVNQLARYLKRVGVKEEVLVGILGERSITFLIGVMATLKAGGAYVPIDPRSPKSRIEYIIQDSGVELLLTSEMIEVSGIRVINPDILDLSGEKKENLENKGSIFALAYIIYTSGSTGKPKGVGIEQRNVLNTISYLESRYPLFKNDSYLFKSNNTFDASIPEIFGWFFGKGKVVVLQDGLEKEPASLLEQIYRHQITHLNFTPSMLRIFFEQIDESNKDMLKSLKYIFAGGEVLAIDLVEKINQLNLSLELENMYGPTEATVYTTSFSTSSFQIGDSMPIGKPLSNVRVYIVDQENNLQPIGVYGELCITGDGLGRGYINRSDLTVEKFQDNPFNPGEKMYRTGDKVRWMIDGNIEYIGRIDQQVKLRGFRIEPGEIENQLIQHKQIKAAAVVVRGQGDGKYLAAYIEATEQITALELREYLAKYLPEYMIPTSFTILEQLPLTPSGKAARNLLPGSHDVVESGVEYLEPSNEIEAELVRIWQEILPNELTIGVLDDFFQLGGHSLNVVTLTAEIHRSFRVQIPIEEVFHRSNLREMAHYIKTAVTVDYIPIEPVEEREYYPLASVQKRIFLLDKLEDVGISYNIPIVVEMLGELCFDRVQAVFDNIIARHSILRTSFTLVDGEPVQRIEPVVKCPIEAQAIAKSDLDSQIKSFIRKFDLAKPPLLRAKIFELSPKLHVLVIDLHHIIADGTSMGIIVQEFQKLYSGEKIAGLPIQYRDYAVWQNEWLKSKQMSAQKEYWLEIFQGEIPVLNLRTDYARPNIQSFQGAHLSFRADRQLTRRLSELALDRGVSLFMLLLAAYSGLLYKYIGQEDLVIGSPIAGRPRADLQKLVGVFINTLAFRISADGGSRFGEHLESVKNLCLKAYENQEYPFERLLEDLQLRRDLSRNPLFDTMFILQNMDLPELLVNDLEIRVKELETETSRFDLTMICVESDGELLFNLEYCTQLFERETAERLCTHYLNLLTAIVEDVERSLDQISIVSSAEREQILAEFNATELTCPELTITISQLFERQVGITPLETALIYADQKLTYQELNSWSNQWAMRLHEFGIRPGDIVGLMIDPSFEMIVCMLGVLKAGGAYLPLDASYPEDRIKFMIEDSSAKILISDSAEAMRELNLQIINPATITYDGQEIENQSYRTNMTDLAYIIYTSGSTGRPKGVMIEHRSVVNFIKGVTEKIDFAGGKRILALTTISFDIFVLESLLPLTKGLEVVVANREQQKDLRELEKLFIKQKIDLLQLTPSRLQLFLNYAPELKFLQDVEILMIGGETLSENLVKRCKGLLNAKLYNMYGPTETTVWSTIKNLSEDVLRENILRKNALTKKDADVNIGRPIANTRIYILDKKNILCPIGIQGEIWVAGKGLARGYLNREELTLEQFAPDPFKPGDRMYHTGDLGYWQKNGDLQFLGRRDQQMKINGYRIEAGEIEELLNEHSAIKEVVVLTLNEANVSKLVAYLVLNNDVTISELRGHLARKLPYYMIPSRFITVESIPQTANGKINRKALVSYIDDLDTGVEYAPLEGGLEETLAEIWSDVLEVEQIGRYDDFFTLGGNSLLVLKLYAKITKLPGYSEIPMLDLYKHSTLQEMARILANARKVERKLLPKLTPYEAKVAVVCVPYAGGDVTVYYPLARFFEKEAEQFGVYAIDLAGQQMGSLRETAVECAKEIIKQIKIPIAIYGHCSGSLLALEITRELEQVGHDVRILAVAANIPLTEKQKRIVRRNSITVQSDLEIVEILKEMGAIPINLTQSELKPVISNYRRDMLLVEDYIDLMHKGEKLKTPLYNIVADKDKVTRGYKKRYNDWFNYAETVTLVELENHSHYFVTSSPDQVGSELKRIIQESLNNHDEIIISK